MKVKIYQLVICGKMLVNKKIKIARGQLTPEIVLGLNAIVVANYDRMQGCVCINKNW